MGGESTMDVEDSWANQENISILATQAKAKLGWRRKRDQLRLEMECLEELQEKRQTEYQMIWKKVHERKPLGIIINSALKDLAACYGKLHGQPWEDKKNMSAHQVGRRQRSKRSQATA